MALYSVASEIDHSSTTNIEQVQIPKVKKTTMGDATYYRKKNKETDRMILYLYYRDAPRCAVGIYQANTRGRRIIVRGSVASIINLTREINTGNSRKKRARIESTVCFDRGECTKLEESTLYPEHERIIKVNSELIHSAQHYYNSYAK